MIFSAQNGRSRIRLSPCRLCRVERKTGGFTWQLKKNALNAGSFCSLSGSGGNPRLIFAPLVIQKSHYGGLKTTNEGIKCQFCGQLLDAKLYRRQTDENDVCREDEWQYIARCESCNVRYTLIAVQTVVTIKTKLKDGGAKVRREFL